jgi:hypothetical protein
MFFLGGHHIMISYNYIHYNCQHNYVLVFINATYFIHWDKYKNIKMAWGLIN